MVSHGLRSHEFFLRRGVIAVALRLRRFCLGVSTSLLKVSERLGVHLLKN